MGIESVLKIMEVKLKYLLVSPLTVPDDNMWILYLNLTNTTNDVQFLSDVSFHWFSVSSES